ncbi:MAG: M48 family metalloprotease, partial [Dehalococcoidia bacterium]|nr:M48 family metalloprotease [Dehalococcoidia bacterium]
MTEWGTLAYELMLEALLVSGLLWAMAELATRLLRITDAAWRVRFFIVPVLFPVVFVPLAHLAIRPIFLGLSPAPLEDFMASLLDISAVWPELFLGAGAVLLMFGVIHACGALATAHTLRQDWRLQRKSALWLRCDAVLWSLSARLRMSPPRLVLTEAASCGCLALGPLGSYIVLSRVLASALDDEEMEALLAHELGHIGRRDTMLGVAAGVCRRL